MRNVQEWGHVFVILSHWIWSATQIFILWMSNQLVLRFAFVLIFSVLRRRPVGLFRWRRHHWLFRHRHASTVVKSKCPSTSARAWKHQPRTASDFFTQNYSSPVHWWWNSRERPRPAYELRTVRSFCSYVSVWEQPSFAFFSRLRECKARVVFTLWDVTHQAIDPLESLLLSFSFYNLSGKLLPL